MLEKIKIFCMTLLKIAKMKLNKEKFCNLTK